MVYHVLCISPYPGLKYAIDQLSREYETIELDSMIGDLAEGERVAKEAIAVDPSYNLIISRGGTAELLKKKLNLPVVDIGVSQYDILKTLQAASMLDKVAVIGFDSITRGTHTVVQDFQMNVPIFTIKADSEVPILLKQVKEAHFEAIIADTVTCRIGKTFGLSTLLITSSDESIRAAFNNALQLLDTEEIAFQTNKLLTDLLEVNHQSLLIFDQSKKQVSTYNLNSDTAYFNKSVKQARQQIKSKNYSTDFKVEDNTYRLTRFKRSNKTVHPSFILDKINYLENILHRTDKDKRNLFTQYENFPEFYHDADQEALLQSAKTLANNSKPIFIVGEEGTGKSFLAHYICSESNHSKSNSYTFNMNSMQQDTFDHMFSDIRSPLFDSGILIFFKNIDRISAAQQLFLMQFINETAVSNRNQVVVSYEEDNRSQVPDSTLKIISEYFSILKLPAFHSLLGRSLVRLVTSGLNRFSSMYEKQVIGTTDLVLDKIINYEWPRNYRQFIKVLYFSYTAATQPYIDNKQFQFGLKQEREQFKLLDQERINKEKSVALTDYIPILYKEDLSQSIRKIALQNLNKNKGNRKKTAEELSISRTTLWRYLNG